MGIVVSSSTPPTDPNAPADEGGKKYVRPKIYLGREGPVFSALDFNKHYATRHVKAALWVSTVVNGTFEQAWEIGVPKLKKYLNGKNLNKCSLPSTCPVLIKKMTNADRGGDLLGSMGTKNDNKLIVSMLIAKKFMNDAPPPVDKDIFLQEEYKHVYCAGTFKKPFSLKNMDDDLEELMEYMDFKGENYEKWFYSLAVYETSCKQLERTKYFEIWFFCKRLEEDYTTIKADDNKNPGTSL